MKALDSGALDYAFQRVEAFALVNHARPADEKVDATALWLEYVGLDEENKRQLMEWLADFNPNWSGEFLLGLVVGLFVNQYNQKNA